MFFNIFKFELLKILADLRSVINNGIFLILAALIFIFAVDSDLSNNKIYGVGIILSLVILAIIMDLDLLFRKDYISGFLEQIFFVDIPIGRFLLAKYFSFLMVTILVKMALLPFILYGFGLFNSLIIYFLVILLLSLPLICAIIFFASMLSFKLEGRAYLVFLIALPLLVAPIIMVMAGMNEIYVNLNIASWFDYVEYLIYLQLIFLPLIYFLSNSLFYYLVRNH